MKRNILDLKNELGDWHATFPNKEAQQVLQLWREDVAVREILIERMRKKLAAAQKACAEMREVLVRHHEWSDNQSKNNEIVYTGPLRSATEHALSSDCGKDYVSRDEVKPLVEALRISNYLIQNCGVFQWKDGIKPKHSFADCADLIEQAMAKFREM